MSDTALMKRPTQEEFETEFRDLLEHKGKIELIKSGDFARTFSRKLTLGGVMAAGSIATTAVILTPVPLGLLVVAGLWGVGCSVALNYFMKRQVKRELKALPPAPAGYSDELAERAIHLRNEWVNRFYAGAPLNDEDHERFRELEDLRADFSAAKEAERLSRLDPSSLLHGEDEDFDRRLLEAQQKANT